MTRKKNSRKQQKARRQKETERRQAEAREQEVLAEKLVEEAEIELEDLAAVKAGDAEATAEIAAAKEELNEQLEALGQTDQETDEAEPDGQEAWNQFGEGTTKESQANGLAEKLKSFWKSFRSLKLWQQILCWVLVIVLALGLTGYGYFHSKYSLLNFSDGKFSSKEISAEGDTQDQLENDALQSQQDSGELSEAEAIEATGEVESDESVFNILLIGTDDRTTEFSDNARGDTCILLSINRETNQLHLVSFERAIGVKILSGDYEGQWDWLTHMFWYGGPYLMTQEIRENFKVDVTKYIRVNIRTFMELVDSVGGVDIDMTEAECNNINHPEGTFTAGNIKGMHVESEVQQDLVPGVNHLNGATAMCYARLRAIDDDWHRVERQRKVILAALENLKELSVTELDELLNNVLPLIQTNLTESDIASLIPEAATFVNMDYDTITFPLKHTYGLMDGMCGRKVLALDFETNAQELQNFLYGETTAEELTEKYENISSSDYSYKNSESYQENYEDAETTVGQGTYVQRTGKSKPTLVEGSGTNSSSTGTSTGTTGSATSGTGTETGTMESGTTGNGDAGTTGTAADTSSSLGALESSTTDPATGVVTNTYYNAETGVRTAVAANPASGAATVTASDTNTGTTTTAHTESGAATDTTAGSEGVATGTDQTTADAAAAVQP